MFVCVSHQSPKSRLISSFVENHMGNPDEFLFKNKILKGTYVWLARMDLGMEQLFLLNNYFHI
jgi:hypothetical protein